MENHLHNEPASFEEIRAILKDVSELQRENERLFKENQRERKKTEEMFKENERERKKTEELFKETAQQMKETDRRLKKLDELFTNQWGALIESLVEGDLVSLLKQWNIAVNHTLAPWPGQHNGKRFEFDIVAMNGEEVVVVEVKTRLRPRDVPHFLKKLDKFTAYVPHFEDKKIYGAVAFLKAHESVQTHAARQGLFVIRATGNSASIVNEETFEPRVFG